MGLFKVEDEKGSVFDVYLVDNKGWDIMFLIYCEDRWCWAAAKNFKPYEEKRLS